jgi:diguanylate cyclase (GGDEF)-like protein
LLQLATYGSVVVVIGVGAFGIWSAGSAFQMADRAVTASRLSNLYDDAATAVAAGESLERKYRLEPGPEVMSRYDKAASDLTVALDLVAREGTDGDRVNARGVLAEHAPYLDAIKRMFAAVDRGETADVLRIDADEVDPRFDLIAQAVDTYARLHREQALRNMEELRTREDFIARLTPFVFLAGLLMVGLFSGLLRRFRNQLDQQRLKALHDSLHDALTGLPNRVLLADRFEQAMRAGRRDGSVTGLLLIDLDRFKDVNDTLGHLCGDRLLAEVAGRLAGALREVDTVARLGGDEFAVLIPAVDGVEGATVVARRLSAALANAFELDGVSFDVEASIGVVVSGQHGDDPAMLLQRADVAMYAAKELGQPVSVYDCSQDQHSPERLALLGQLRRGIERGELFLHFQPKISLKTQEVMGVEALVRWRHPTRGLVPPVEFIPYAEHTALIGPLTRYVVDAALTQARTWADAGYRIPVVVNISARNLLDNDFARDVDDLLRRHRVPADLLGLEVTESAIMLKPQKAHQLLNQLHELGVRLAIDDFGAGYTSLGQLRNLPISELKIDRSFVMNMQTDQDAAVIVRSVIELGHNLGLSVVAEGVETAGVATTLAGYQCDVAQGYHLCRPLPPDAFLLWYRQRASDPTTAVRRPPATQPRAISIGRSTAVLPSRQVLGTV